MGANGSRGRTGQKVEEAGTYRCEQGGTASYTRGDTFGVCPTTGKPTVWEKTHDPDHPGGNR